MKYVINRTEYFDAVDAALDAIKTNRSGDVASRVLGHVLGYVWDTKNWRYTESELPSMDAVVTEIAWNLLLGRTRYGRPWDYPATDEIRRLIIDDL